MGSGGKCREKKNCTSLRSTGGPRKKIEWYGPGGRGEREKGIAKVEGVGSSGRKLKFLH